jgi:hypothetical protein
MTTGISGTYTEPNDTDIEVENEVPFRKLK